MAAVSVNGVELYFEEHGTGQPIVGIHGSPSSAVLWAGAAAELANHGRCVLYDRRGFYRSASPEPLRSLDLAQHVDDLAALVATLGAEPAVLIGRSTGGLIALEFARRFPDKVNGLVLLEPALFTLDPKADAWAADTRRRVLAHAEVEPARLAEALLRDALGDETWAAFPHELQNILGATSPAVLAEMRGHGLDLSGDPLVLGEEALAGVRVPALVVSAEDSLEAYRLVNARLAAHLPHAETVLVPGGHLIDPAHPAVLSFIDRLSPELPG